MTNDIERLAEQAGFVVNMMGQIVTPAPTEDARQPLERFAALVRAEALEDSAVLEAALRVMSLGLDSLAAACIGEDGKPRAPDRGALMKARALLPSYCERALKDKPCQF